MTGLDGTVFCEGKGRSILDQDDGRRLVSHF